MMTSLLSCHNDVWMSGLALLWLSCHQPDDKASPGMAERWKEYTSLMMDLSCYVNQTWSLLYPRLLITLENKSPFNHLSQFSSICYGKHLK